MSFEVNRSEGLRVKIYGKEYSLKKPSVKMIEGYAIGIEKVETAEKFARAKSLLTGMGLAVDVIDDLEFDHLQKLIEFLTDNMASSAKKN